MEGQKIELVASCHKLISFLVITHHIHSLFGHELSLFSFTLTIANQHSLLQEDGKKTAHLKSNSFFEHDKSVNLLSCSKYLSKHYTLFFLSTCLCIILHLLQVGAVVVGLDQYINFYKLQ